MIIVETYDTNFLAAFLNEEKATSYAEDLAQQNISSEKKVIPFNSFPIYAIVPLTLDDAGNNRQPFEYKDQEGLLKLIAGLDNITDDNQVYFTYYLIDEEYNHESTEDDYMRPLYHSQVDSGFLKDYYKVYGDACLVREHIDTLVNGFYLARMDKLYRQCMSNGSYIEKKDLAEAYLEMFGLMQYDFACGKLNDEGLAGLIPVIENIESLLGTKEWLNRTQATLILMEAEKENNLKVKYAHKAIEGLFQCIIWETESLQWIYENVAFSHQTIAECDPNVRNAEWEEALRYIKKATQINPFKSDWQRCLSLLYIPFEQEGPLMVIKRLEEQESFRGLLLAFYEDLEGIENVIANAFYRFREYCKFYDKGQIFPEEDYMYWLEKSLTGVLTYYPNETYSTTDMGHFYNAEGVRFGRIDLLERANQYFALLVHSDTGFHALVIHYIAKNFEDMAHVFIKNGQPEKADNAMTRSLAWYTNNLDLVKKDFSALVHYSEFLERCYQYQGKIQKPSIEDIRTFATLSEEQGKGFYSSPYFLLARLALYEQDESSAISFLTRSLILHELCIDDNIRALMQNPRLSSFPKMTHFLQETLDFMEEVKKGYYLDTEIKWTELRLLSDLQVEKAWSLRKEELRNRNLN